MIDLISAICRDVDADPVPDALVTRATALAARALTPEEARAAWAEMVPALRLYRLDPEFLVASALIYEKCREVEGMLVFWANVQMLCPDSTMALRMLMRWYRRMKMVYEGVKHLSDIHVDWTDDAVVAERKFQGYVELHAIDMVDGLMADFLAAHPDALAMRLRYVKHLVKLGRVSDASQIGAAIIDRRTIGLAAQTLLAEVDRLASDPSLKSLPNPTTALTDIVASFVPRVPRALARDRLGPMAFYTGQLGPGGAERQMSRLAVAMQDGFHTSGHSGGVRLLQPPKVCVRHIKQATNSDFFAAILTDNGVDLTVLNDVPLPDSRAVVDERQQGLMALLSVLPEDVMHSILKFAAYFRRNATDVAYIWQDGGVLIGAPAALIAGVPRIVTSFRGLPPNIRPENMRPQYPQFQKTLARVPGVTFSANCVATARAYEEWLDLDLGAVRVIPNAVPDTQPLGAPEDEALWAEVLRRSPDCTQTVLGVFRFDPNKRPELWIEVATRYLETHPDARFVMFGMGTEHAKCAMLVQDRGLADRIFICGVTRSVGYFMTRSDVVMHLARWEGLPNVVIEAQMAGVPVLATPAGGTDEIVDHGETGFILSQADDPPVAEIVETLGRMLSDDALLKRMGAQAKVRAAARFTIDSVLRKTMSLFLEDRV